MKYRLKTPQLSFIRYYRLLSFTAAMTLVAIILQLTHHQAIAHWFLIVGAVIACFPLLNGMWQDFATGSYGVEILALVSIVTALLLKQYWAAIIVVLLLTGSETLESFAARRSKAEFSDLLAHVPLIAHIIRGGKVTDISPAQVRVNDRVLVRAGEVVPVDGTIIEGSSGFDVTRLTGEALPEDHVTGDEIFSGAVVKDADITIKALRTAADSQYQQTVKLVKAAASSQAPIIRLADRYSIPFTVFALLLGAAMWIISGHAIRFLEVIIVATPTPLVLAAPIAIMSGMNRAAQYGIIVRTGSALEHLANVRTMAFNKSGTLTSDTPTVAEIITFGGHKKADILALAGALEAASGHGLAKAITLAAGEQKVKIPKARHVAESAGHGLTAVVGGKKVFVGRASLLKKHDVALPPAFNPRSIKLTAAYVAVDGELAGVITFTDTVKPGSKSLLESLKNLGVRHFMLLSGDTAAAVKPTARKLEISDVVADALPATKLHAIEGIHHRPVAFVGNSASDAPVLTTADIGIAVGARSSSAAESADIVIPGNEVGRVAVAVRIAKRSLRIAKRSTLVGIGLSVALMILFATGILLPIYGALLQEAVDILVIATALTAHAG